MKTLIVKGIGKISIKPDICVVSFSISEIDKIYSKSIGSLTDKINNIMLLLKKSGVNKENTKISRLKISQEYEIEHDKHYNKKKIFKGFKSLFNINIHIVYDNNLINQIISRLMETDIKSEISISFRSSKKEEIENEILEKAMKNAIKKAEILAISSGCRLGQIQKISQTWTEISIRSIRYDMGARCESVPLGADCNIIPHIDPEDLDVNEQVEVIWELLPS